MQKILQYSLLFFFLLLPFHAFGVTVLNNILYGSEFGAPFWMKAWKEVFLLFIFFLAGITIFLDYNKKKKRGEKRIYLDILDVSILLFSIVALVISFLKGIELSNIIYGIKYDLLPLWLFLILKHVSFSKDFRTYLFKNLGYIGSIIIFLGGLFLFTPQEIFIALGYSADTSFHAINRPLASCQMISFTDICRAQSTLSGPNQFSAYLLLLIPLFTYLFGSSKKFLHKNFWGIMMLLAGITLVLTFSRSAWIGLYFGAIVFISFCKYIPLKKYVILSFLFLPLIIGILFFTTFPEYADKIITRSESSSEHYTQSLEGILSVINSPFGNGLSSAGAASKYGSDVIGVIPENWYLQIAMETGVLGLILFIIIILGVMYKLLRLVLINTDKTKKMVQKTVEFFSGRWDPEEDEYQKFISHLEPLFLLSVLVSISIMSLMLHAWESAAVSYSVWGLLGISIMNRK